MWVGKQQEQIQEECFKYKTKTLAQDDHPVLEISVEGNVDGSTIQYILFFKPSYGITFQKTAFQFF